MFSKLDKRSRELCKNTKTTFWAPLNKRCTWSKKTWRTWKKKQTKSELRQRWTHALFISRRSVIGLELSVSSSTRWTKIRKGWWPLLKKGSRLKARREKRCTTSWWKLNQSTKDWCTSWTNSNNKAVLNPPWKACHLPLSISNLRRPFRQLWMMTKTK